MEDLFADFHHGLLALERVYRLLDERAFLQVRSDRRAYLPYGLHGGRPGTPSLTYLETEGGRQLLPTKVTMELGRHHRLVHRHAGGGGWGDPRRRDPEHVARDVREGKVSPGAAREPYGVAVRGDGAVDDEGTARLRERGSGPAPCGGAG